MFRKSVRVSLFQLFVHEIYSEARKRSRNSLSPLAITENLASAITTQAKQLFGSILVFVVIGILLHNLGGVGSFTLNTPYFTISLPAIYICFVGVFSYYVAIISLLQLMVIIVGQSRIQNSRELNISRPSAYMLISGSDQYDFISTIRPGKLFSPKGGGAVSLLIATPLIFCIIPIFGSIFTYFSYLRNEIFHANAVYLGTSLGVISALIFAISFLSIIIYFIPLPIRKEVDFIRWSFLINTTGNGGLHHNAKRWLGRNI